MAYVGRNAENKIVSYSPDSPAPGIAEEYIDDNSPELLAFLNPPAPPYTIGADVPWSRMVDDEEAETVQSAVDGSPAKTRNMINKATSFTQGTDAFNKFRAIITAALNADRAETIMGPLQSPELTVLIGEGATFPNM